MRSERPAAGDTWSRSRSRSRTVFHLGTALVVAWGALAFGAVYSWAFWPLAAVSAACGVFGLAVRPAGPARLPSIASDPFVGCLTTVAAAIALQLVPVPADMLSRLSPRAEAIVRELDVSFASGLVSQHALSIAPPATTIALALFLAFALMMLGVARVTSLGGPRALAVRISAIGVFVALVGIVSKPLYAGRIYGVWEPLMGGRPFGPFVNPNHFAGWMLMALPLTFGLLCSAVARAAPTVRPGWRHRIIWCSSRQASETVVLGASAAVMAISLVLTMSRSGILAFATTVAVTSWFVIRRLPGESKRLVVAAYLAGVVILAIGSVGSDALAARFGSANPANINERLPIWRDTARMVDDFWLTGTGLNTYGVATLFYQTAEPDVHLREAHNDYLQIAAEGGLLVSLPVACAIILFAWQVRRRFQSSHGSSYWIRLGAATGIVAVALQSTVDFSLQMPGNAALFAVLCGIALHDGTARHAAARVQRSEA